jgi:hypothetical protein
VLYKGYYMGFSFEHVQNFVRCCIEPHIVAVKRHIDSLHLKCFGSLNSDKLKVDIVPWFETPLDTVVKGAIICFAGEINSNGNPIINGVPDTKWRVCDGTNNTPNLTTLFNSTLNIVYIQHL